MYPRTYKREILVFIEGIIDGFKGLNSTPGTKLCISYVLWYNDPQILCLKHLYLNSFYHTFWYSLVESPCLKISHKVSSGLQFLLKGLPWRICF